MKNTVASFRSVPRLIAIAALALIAITATACGGDDDDSAGATCTSTADLICTEACNCGAAAGCILGDASGAITFDNKAGCVAFYGLACSSTPPPDIDFAACTSALANPTCVQATEGMALQEPAACEPAEDLPDAGADVDAT